MNRFVDFYPLSIPTPAIHLLASGCIVRRPGAGAAAVPRGGENPAAVLVLHLELAAAIGPAGDVD